MKVLVTGATGYVGSRLVPELLRRGHDVVAGYASRRQDAFAWSSQVDWRHVDLLALPTVVEGLRDVDAAVYLVHGLSSRDFADSDREAAETMRDAVGVVGLPRLVYLSGIIPDVEPDRLSAHLASRLEVERILAESAASTLTLRAAIIVGAGSTSFELVRQLSERLPLVQGIPSWMEDTRVQPVAIADVVHYLTEAVEDARVEGHLDIGGPDTVRYPELLDRYARIAGLTRVQVPLPGLPSDLVGWLAGQLTEVDTDTVQTLMGSLRDDMVAGDDARSRLGDPRRPMTGLDDAIRAALAEPDPATDGSDVDGDPAAPAEGDRLSS